MPLVNVGRGGALVESSVPLPPQSVHQVAVTCDGMPTPASVQVRHVSPVVGPDGRTRYLIGLQFLTMPATLLEQIEAWLGHCNGAAVVEGV
jgi:hypothetical protein